ncbi:MAG: YfiM family protein [Chitinophagales bacterium]|nr:YfiM family protein [Chitinophagales bacterium]
MKVVYTIILFFTCGIELYAQEVAPTNDTIEIFEDLDSSIIKNEWIYSEKDAVIFQEEPKERIKFIQPYKFFENSKEPNLSRLLTLNLSIGTIYAGMNSWWSSAWYSKYDRERFHLFNDNGEWLQMDKAAHIFNAYFISRWGHNLYRWAGVPPKHSPWVGMLVGNMWQLSIEVHDGFSKKWGFSWGDMAANFSGSLIFGLQQYFWHDQKLNIKISATPEKYPEVLKDRTNHLYGTTIGELILKDYNAMTFWLNVSPGAFIKKPESKFPKWLSVSLGYGGTGMYGGFENRWCANKDKEVGECPPDEILTPKDYVGVDIPRVRQFYISWDIDFTKIPSNKPALKTFLELINIIKVPFPALEFRSDGKVKWNWYQF